MKREITKLVADGLYREALCLYSQHHSLSLPPNKFTFPSLLKACGKLKAPVQGQMVHTHIIKTGFGIDIYTSTAITDMYLKLHRFEDALKVFTEIPEPNLASLNVAISGFLQNGYFNEALRVFTLVRDLGPSTVSIASVLSACESVKHGDQLHCLAVKLGVETEVYVGTSLVSMYCSCAELVSAAKVFQMVSDRNVVSYNAYISGLLRNGVPRVVLDVFKDMRGFSGEVPNSVTFISVISACSELHYLRFGRQVHGLVAKYNMGFDIMVGTALVDMYSKCGCWQWAYDIFNELNGSRNLITWNSMIVGMMSNGQSNNAIELFVQLESEGLEPDSATWNSMISGFSQLGRDVEAIIFFKRMQSAGVMPSMKSITSLLPACSALYALRCGKEIHGHTIRTDICRDEFISTALIDMYMKCGQSSWARKVFDQFETKTSDPAIWNALLSGYGRNGEYETAFKIFDQMVEEKVQPNSATFNIILSVCSHTGQVEKGWQVFRMMNRDYCLSPTHQHFNCMVDLLGRSGRLNEAWELLQKIPEPSASVFASLLGACRCHSDSKLGEEVAEKLLELEPKNPTPYVILSNIYAAQGRWKDLEMVRETMNDRKLKKHPGLSLIGVT
ncbi:pentatricopeptide repeat-containing protein At2g02750 [Cornus florida]|uniref:pentatricopeptide repeat-containing protein At2g02750 n=1 Tax=Cornus florida TaxID=4283 RepID=UPI00289B7420|nr:pentatricopeptide repeat-containing protein At2g02750 [Cornus florida]